MGHSKREDRDPPTHHPNFAKRLLGICKKSAAAGDVPLFFIAPGQRPHSNFNGGNRGTLNSGKSTSKYDLEEQVDWPLI